ncbi:hypothetical protein PSTT_11714 [Puccinia striiformis]|uniref:Peroxisome assembly protein 12 n=1 Tax=Puccinia striiformis TaxID=27350 RepID=A0A2S4UYY6_9BASI|nr:hypothetical protein PSTT_11714 [Puccinia striiformis]
MDITDEELHRPNFFELVAQDQLRELIGPVIRYVTSIFAQRYPRYLIKLLNHHDEVFAVMMYLIERYYLKNWSGSFAENFYGLSRRRHCITKPVSLPGSTTGSKGNPGRLASRDVGIPYLRAKAAGLHETLGGNSANDLLDDEPERPSHSPNTDDSRIGTIKSSALKIFKTSYPHFLAISVDGNEIRRMSPHDQDRMQHELDSRKISPFARDLTTGRMPDWRLIVGRSWNMISHRFYESLKVLLPGSIFFFKFLEWWYSSSNTSRYRPSLSESDGSQFPAIQPPVPLKPQVKGVLGDGTSLTKPVPKGHCPLCRTKLANPTAAPSGWVYCYKCIHAYVVEFQRCPVTLFPTSLANLRKIIG